MAAFLAAEECPGAAVEADGEGACLPGVISTTGPAVGLDVAPILSAVAVLMPAVALLVEEDDGVVDGRAF